ncbi:MAG: GNAT family N-acetyltransferase [Solirubrobacteraceae bacterium]
MILALFDEAVAWLVAREQPGQWGREPPSQRPETRVRVQEMATGGGLRVAQHDGVTVGALVVGTAPRYAPRREESELYLVLLLVSRKQAGQSIGTHLIDIAVNEARERGAVLLRVDCWAGAPGLIRYYERHAFTRAETFCLNGWDGQILERKL